MEKTEINFEELKNMIREMGLEKEFDVMVIGRCSVCCEVVNGGNC